METNQSQNNPFTQRRSEEVRDIIERMPTHFSRYVSMIVAGIFALLLFFGWLIRYPDMVSGELVVNTPVSPIKLIAASSGQLHLLQINSMSQVKKEQSIALIENGASYETLQKIKKLLEAYHLEGRPNISIMAQLPEKVMLGELTPAYNAFLISLHQMYDFKTDRIYDKQQRSLEQLTTEQQKEVDIFAASIGTAEENLRFLGKAHTRDSILFYGRVSSEAEFDKAKQSILSGKANVDAALGRHIGARKALQQTNSQITELMTLKHEKERELELNVAMAYNELTDNIRQWEQKYLLRAPFDGHVQFLKFWTDKQFVQLGEPVFTIVPDEAEPYGQVMLPVIGAGKVKVGQEATIKLHDYPFREYGTIKGRVTSISLTSHPETMSQNNVDAYLVTIQFDRGMITNYGRLLVFKHESKGIAEIITNDRKLIERFFDNLNRAVSR